MEAPQPPHPHGTPFLRVMALLAFALLIALLASFGTYYYLSRSVQVPPAPVAPTSAPSGHGKACPMLAKACPDGSYVSMTGPNCEFSACPTSSDSAIIKQKVTDMYKKYDDALAQDVISPSVPSKRELVLTEFENSSDVTRAFASSLADGSSFQDPFLCAQNVKTPTATVKEPEIKGDEASIVVESHWDVSAPSIPVGVNLVKLNNEWKINRLACLHD